MSAMCQPCADEWMRWLDYRPPAPIKIAQSGSGLHNVRQGVRTIETIRSQQALIVRLCREGNHVSAGST